MFDFSAEALLVAFLVGSIGMGLFLYGKKQARIPHLIAGLALMVYPGFVSSAWADAGIAAGVLGALWLAVRAGY